MNNLGELQRDFANLYGADRGAPRLFRAPGRVNLIGEHTDYNDGYVLPMALERSTVVAAHPRPDRRIRVRSLNVTGSISFDLDATPQPQKRSGWGAYVEGVARSLESRMQGAGLRGADMLIASDVPVGAGLSSSAALEISTGFALLSLANLEIDRTQLALAGQQAEHEWAGTKSGIMDQFIAAHARARHALLLDCRTLQYEAVPLDADDTVIVICDTGVKHSLASSAYNERRAECERGVELLRLFLPDIRALRDVSLSEFAEYEARLPEPVRRRCRHVVTENERTLLTAEAFRRRDAERAGELMYASHASLRDDYEVSCAELDLMVEIASKIPGVFGARMTGGGFGGCTVNLIKRGYLDEFQRTMKDEYRRASGREPPIYTTRGGSGAEEIIEKDERGNEER